MRKLTTDGVLLGKLIKKKKRSRSEPRRRPVDIQESLDNESGFRVESHEADCWKRFFGFMLFTRLIRTEDTQGFRYDFVCYPLFRCFGCCVDFCSGKILEFVNTEAPCWLTSWSHFVAVVVVRFLSLATKICTLSKLLLTLPAYTTNSLKLYILGYAKKRLPFSRRFAVFSVSAARSPRTSRTWKTSPTRRTSPHEASRPWPLGATGGAWCFFGKNMCYCHC